MDVLDGYAALDAWEQDDESMRDARLLVDIDIEDVPESERADVARRAELFADQMIQASLAIDDGDDSDACMELAIALLDVAREMRGRWSYEAICTECGLVAAGDRRAEIHGDRVMHQARLAHEVRVHTVVVA